MRINSTPSLPSFKAKFSPEVKELLQDRGGEIIRKHGEKSKEFDSFKRIVKVMKEYCPESTIQIVKKNGYEDHDIYEVDKNLEDGCMMARIYFTTPHYEIILKDSYSEPFPLFLDCNIEKSDLIKGKDSYYGIRNTMKAAQASNYGSADKRRTTETEIKPVIDKLLEQ